MASLGACVQGWAQTSLNGANLSWPFFLDFPRCNNSDTAPYFWLFGFVNAVPWFSASLVGTWFADPVQNALKLGRRGAIFLAALFTFASCLCSAGAGHWRDLLACRLLLGLGMYGISFLVHTLSRTALETILLCYGVGRLTSLLTSSYHPFYLLSCYLTKKLLLAPCQLPSNSRFLSSSS